MIHVHLGLIGQLDVHTDVAESRRRSARSACGSRPTDAYADLRGAIVCDLVTTARRDEVMARLGPGPAARGRRADACVGQDQQELSAIGDLLMDQEVLAGIGNVYRAEALFRHRMHPSAGAHAARRPVARDLGRSRVPMPTASRLGRSTRSGPSTRPRRCSGRPRDDDHGGEVYVYCRAARRATCAGPGSRTEILVGRNLFRCAHCSTAVPIARRTVSANDRRRDHDHGAERRSRDPSSLHVPGDCVGSRSDQPGAPAKGPSLGGLVVFTLAPGLSAPLASLTDAPLNVVVLPLILSSLFLSPRSRPLPLPGLPGPRDHCLDPADGGSDLLLGRHRR